MNIYVVRSKDGEFFRAKGFGRSGENWVESLDKARLYTKIGPAKGTVTYFAKNYPEYGTCDILEFTLDVSQAKVMDMSQTTAKSIKKIKDRELAQEQRRVKYELERLEADEKRIAARRKELKRG